jgi:hypothetical protein
LTYIALTARENPFFPTESIDSMPITSNQITKYQPLKRVALSLPNHARVLEEITVSYKNLDGSIEKKTIQVNRSIDWHIPLFVSQSYTIVDETKSTKTKKKAKKINFKFIDFDISKNEMLVHTKDELIRNFLLINPHRIVLDFKREAHFLSYEKSLTTLPFKELRIGNHDGYYRVVISLDGHYQYEIDPLGSSYKIIIH